MRNTRGALCEDSGMDFVRTRKICMVRSALQVSKYSPLTLHRAYQSRASILLPLISGGRQDGNARHHHLPEL